MDGIWTGHGWEVDGTGRGRVTRCGWMGCGRDGSWTSDDMLVDGTGRGHGWEVGCGQDVRNVPSTSLSCTLDFL